MTDGNQQSSADWTPRALCLSGGGYRAALFHLGVLTRLNQIGALGRIDTISSVSGGSIIAAFLAEKVNPWPSPGEVVDDWQAKVVVPFLTATSTDIRTGPFLKWLTRLWASDTAVRSLAKRYGTTPFGLGNRFSSRAGSRPRLLINATDMQFGVDWTFDTAAGRHGECGDEYAGRWEVPAEWPLSLAVAASSCFPPIFNPLKVGHQLGDRPRVKEPVSAQESPADTKAQRPLLPRGVVDPQVLRKQLALSDGGVYDNLGVHAVWKDHRVVIASDGGGVFGPAQDKGILSRLARYQAISGHGGTLVRREWLIDRLESKQVGGAYLGIGSSPEHFPEHPLSYPQNLISRFIATIRTDLNPFSETEQKVLINHGYSLAVAAITSYLKIWEPSDIEAEWPFAKFADPTRFSQIEHALRNSHKRKILGVYV